MIFPQISINFVCKGFNFSLNRVIMMRYRKFLFLIGYLNIFAVCFGALKHDCSINGNKSVDVDYIDYWPKSQKVDWSSKIEKEANSDYSRNPNLCPSLVPFSLVNEAYEGVLRKYSKGAGCSEGSSDEVKDPVKEGAGGTPVERDIVLSLKFPEPGNEVKGTDYIFREPWYDGDKARRYLDTIRQRSVVQDKDADCEAKGVEHSLDRQPHLVERLQEDVTRLLDSKSRQSKDCRRRNESKCANCGIKEAKRSSDRRRDLSKGFQGCKRKRSFR